MANSTKRDIVQKLRHEERLAIRATRFMKKPMTIRQTKRTIRFAIVGGLLIAVLSVLRFTVLDAAYEPSISDAAPPSATPTPTPSVVQAMSIEELENQAYNSKRTPPSVPN